MNYKLRHIDGGEVRAVLEDGKRLLKVLAAPFGSIERKDRLNQFLSPNTDFMIDVGDRRPTLYMHGFSPNKRMMKKPTPIGVSSVVELNSLGLWMEAELDNSELSDRVWEAALNGRARASTGSVNYLERHDEVTGEVYVWPIAELSVFDLGNDRLPVSDDAIVLPLRSIFEECDIELPRSFEAGEDKNDNEVSKQSYDKNNSEELEMDKNEIEQLVTEKVSESLKGIKQDVDVEALRSSIKSEVIAEMKENEEPNYRSTFNIKKVTQGTVSLSEEEKETHEFIYNLRADGLRVANGGQPARRTIEESEALEGAPMVPDELLNRIWELRQEKSLVRKSGMRTMVANRLKFDVPVETSDMSVLPTVAEEGTYITNEPAFESKQVTMVKKGSLVSVTEEMLEDQDLFQSYLVRECGNALALAENKYLFDLIDAIDGTEIATQHTPTAGEIIDLYTSLGEYIDGSVWLMNPAWMGYLLQLELTGASYAFWQPSQWGGVGGKGQVSTFMGQPLYTESTNWRDKTAADDEGIIDFVNLSESIAWFDRRGLQIFVDPYGDSLNGRVRYYPSARFGGVVVNSAGIKRLDDHS